ncbi:MAG: glycosyltransferase [Alphaproteobacteria bacterium]|nr:glycosyltransferase [Alphaproteobacteria bacterium]
MSILVAYPGTGEFAQQIALAMLEEKMLEAFVTTFAVHADDGALRALGGLPGRSSARLRHSLMRRSVDLVPSEKLLRRTGLDLLRTSAFQAGFGAHFVDTLWDLMSHDFTRYVARLVRERAPYALYAYEYTAREAFAVAQQVGTIRILDLPSLSSRSLEGLLARESERFPELRAVQDRYFKRRFPERQARRDTEIADADLIVCNSTVTRNSHVAEGADGARMIVVPLAAPPTIDEARPRAVSGPLRLIWAGTFSVRKGAHYLLDACRDSALQGVEIDIYGTVTLPARACVGIPEFIHLKGAVPRQDLLRQFEEADALIFPTLSDGFGLVVTEALSRGLPVITTDRAGAADLIRHHENGLVIRAHDAQAIKDAIGWCLDHRHQLNAMRPAALATAKARQWPQYRREFMTALRDGLLARGFSWPAVPHSAAHDLKPSAA